MGVRDGDRFTRCGLGHLHRGVHGAAGLLVYHDGDVLLRQRARWTHGGNTWALFGGARQADENPVEAAVREATEESTLMSDAVRVHGVVENDHGDWIYHTVLATAGTRLEVLPASRETGAAAWVPEGRVGELPLYAPFASAWPALRPGLRRPVLVVDCANVMGARADGWWRDRAGAAARLRDDLGRLAGCGTGELTPFDLCLPEIVLVVEGAARGIGRSATGIEVVDAPGSGDDTIVALVAGRGPDTRHLVVTADRELRGRCRAAGAEVLGPRWLLALLDAG